MLNQLLAMLYLEITTSQVVSSINEFLFEININTSILLQQFNSPLEQFNIVTFVWSNSQLLSTINNISWFILIILFINIFFYQGQEPSQKMSILAICKNTMYNELHNFHLVNLDSKNNYWTIILMFLFFLIISSNLMGLIPLSYTITATFIIPLILGSTFMLIAFARGFYKNKWRIFNLFIPSGVPVMMVAPIFFLEFIAIFTKTLSMSIRLSANMLSGHALLVTVFGVVAAVATSIYWPVYGLVFSVFIVLELLIAFIQTYVFAMLVLIYFSDFWRIH